MNLNRKMEDYRFGALCSLVASAVGGKRISPSVFFPSLKEYDKPQSPKEMIAIAEMISAIQNARIGEA